MRLVAIVSLALGALMLGDGLYIWSKAAFGQMLLERSWESSLAKSKPEKPWSWADISPVAKLYIPRLERTTIVLDGSNAEAMAWGPGHMKGTALPGDPGLSVIAGHRDTHFAVLGQIKIGDRINIERYDSLSVQYQIVSRQVVNANQPGLVSPEDTSILALVTCWPLNALQAGGDDRLVLLARQVPAANI